MDFRCIQSQHVLRLNDMNIPKVVYLTKRFKLGGSSKLHSAKSLEGSSFCNVCSQKRK